MPLYIEWLEKAEGKAPVTLRELDLYILICASSFDFISFLRILPVLYHFERDNKSAQSIHSGNSFN
jgi:hypothetical protein